MAMRNAPLRHTCAVISLFVASGALGWIACGGNSRSGADADGAAAVPVCTLDGGPPVPYAVPAFGTFLGPALSGDICSGGAFAYLERSPGPITIPSQLVLPIDASTDTPDGFIHFLTPSNATGGSLMISVGANAAAPGTYPSTETCGGVTFCVYLSVPPSVDCGDASAPTSCPPGCSLIGVPYYSKRVHGPNLGPLTCEPTTPENCYAAQASGDCMGTTQTPKGTWTLTLTSVVPYGGEDGGPGTNYVVHGTFTTTMIGEEAGLGTANLTVTF
jgi:hypothetical protein